MPLSRHPIPGPHRARQKPLGDALETRTERLRDHFRYPIIYLDALVVKVLDGCRGRNTLDPDPRWPR